jgi:hypothetical protein
VVGERLGDQSFVAITTNIFTEFLDTYFHSAFHHQILLRRIFQCTTLRGDIASRCCCEAVLVERIYEVGDCAATSKAGSSSRATKRKAILQAIHCATPRNTFRLQLELYISLFDSTDDLRNDAVTPSSLDARLLPRHFSFLSSLHNGRKLARGCTGQVNTSSSRGYDNGTRELRKPVRILRTSLLRIQPTMPYNQRPSCLWPGSSYCKQLGWWRRVADVHDHLR